MDCFSHRTLEDANTSFGWRSLRGAMVLLFVLSFAATHSTPCDMILTMAMLWCFYFACVSLILISSTCTCVHVIWLLPLLVLNWPWGAFMIIVTFVREESIVSLFVKNSLSVCS